MNSTPASFSDLDLRSSSRTIVAPASIGVLAVGAAVIIFIGWTAFAPIASAIVTHGTVVTKSKVQVVQQMDGGIIRAIRVRDGDLVSTGQVLVELDTQRQESIVKTLRVELVGIIAHEARLRSELNNRTTIVFPIEEAEVILSEYPSILQDQASYFFARMSAFKLRALALDNEHDRDVAILAGLRKQLIEISARVGLSSTDRSAAVELARTGSGTQRAVRDSQAAEATLVGEQAALETRMADVISQLGHNRIDLDRAKVALQEEDSLELQQILRDKQDVIQRLNDASLSIQRSIVKAPVDGEVFNLAVHTVSGVVQPGSSLLEILPRDQPLLIEAQIDPSDAADVALGSNVMIRADGAGSHRLPMMAGEVIWISADRVTDRNGAVGYFPIQIEINNADLAPGMNPILKPGRPFEVIVTKKPRSLISYLLSPLIASFSRSMRE